MFSTKTPKDVYNKLVLFFQMRKENKYRAQLDQDSSDFQEHVKEKIQHNEFQEFEYGLDSENDVDVEQELKKIGVSHIDDIDENTQISSKIRSFLNKVRKKIQQKFHKGELIESDIGPKLDFRKNYVAMPKKEIKEDLKKRIDKNQAVGNMLAQKQVSMARLRESSLEAQKNSQKHAELKVLDGRKTDVVKKSDIEQRGNNSKPLKNDPNDLNKDGKVDNQEKSVQKSNEQRNLHTKFFADAVNNIGEKERKSEWVGNFADTVVKNKEGGNGRSF